MMQKLVKQIDKWTKICRIYFCELASNSHNFHRNCSQIIPQDIKLLPVYSAKRLTAVSLFCKTSKFVSVYFAKRQRLRDYDYYYYYYYYSQYSTMNQRLMNSPSECTAFSRFKIQGYVFSQKQITY